jgi:hypothetical protein
MDWKLDSTIAVFAAHRGVVLQHVPDALRLLVLDQFRRIAGDRKGRLQRAARAQYPGPSAARDLAAGIDGERPSEEASALVFTVTVGSALSGAEVPDCADSGSS